MILDCGDRIFSVNESFNSSVPAGMWPLRAADSSAVNRAGWRVEFRFARTWATSGHRLLELPVQGVATKAFLQELKRY